MSFPSIKVIETSTVQLAWSGHVYTIQLPFSKAGCQSTALPRLPISINKLHPLEHRYHLWEVFMCDWANLFKTAYLKPFYAVCASLCGVFEFINCRSFIQNVDKEVFASQRHISMCSAAPSHDCWLSNLPRRRLSSWTSLQRKMRRLNDPQSTSCGTLLGWEEFQTLPTQDRKPLAAANFHHPVSQQLRYPFLWPELMQMASSRAHHTLQRSFSKSLC